MFLKYPSTSELVSQIFLSFQKKIKNSPIKVKKKIVYKMQIVVTSAYYG